MGALAGCRHKPPVAPDEVYSQIESEFVAGDLSRAQEHSQQAYQRFASSHPDWAARFRVELGKVLVYQGKSSDAQALLKQPLPANASVELQVRRNIFLSLAETWLGHLDAAEVSVSEAERQCPEGVLRAEVFGARGVIYIKEGRLDDAERSLQSSLSVARSGGNKFLQTQTLMNLGVIAIQEEHYEDALSRFGEISTLARSIGARLALEKAEANLGWAYYKIGDFQRSLINSQEAERAASELGSTIDQVGLLNNAGLSEYRLGNIDAARSFYQRALQLAQSIQNQQLILDAHVNLAFLLLRSDNPDAAEPHIREANGIVAQTKNDRAALEPMLLDALLLKARGNRQGAASRLLDLEKRAAIVPSLQWQVENTLAQMYAQTGDHTAADKWYRTAIDTFHHQRSSLSNVESQLPFLENGSDLYTGYADYLIAEDRTDEALDVIDRSRAETLAEKDAQAEPATGSRDKLNAKAIAARLHGTILVYSLRPQESFLWAVTGSKLAFYRLPGSESLLPLLRGQNRSILASKDLLTQQNSAARDLYDRLVKPAEALIQHGSRVFIVADRELNNLNFETLITPGDQPHFWIEDVTLSNAGSLRLLSAPHGKEPQHAGQQRAAANVLLVGDPVYTGQEYPALPKAAAEVEEVAKHFTPDRRTVLTGPSASPSAYQSSQPGHFAYIHFVAHATASQTTPLDSAVVLSKNPHQPDVYKLYARDILREPLHADLVTLSACYGSGLRIYSGEGLVGLAWAFQRAGSRNVIGAMWDVSDASTPELMDRLYAELAKGSPPDAALRSAKLSLLHGTGVFRKPLYWAPFQLYSSM